MRKIMFNDKYGLTYSVLNCVKSMTRRLIKFRDYYNPNRGVEIEYDTKTKQCCLTQGQMIVARSLYFVGEVVAVAQCYWDVYHSEVPIYDLGETDAGVFNKMFVRAESMPHHIKITNITAQHLQDISEIDAMREGINNTFNGYQYSPTSPLYRSARGAFTALIDKVSRKGTWNSNPFVWVYEFELVD